MNTPHSYEVLGRKSDGTYVIRIGEPFVQISGEDVDEIVSVLSSVKENAESTVLVLRIDEILKKLGATT